MIELIESLGLQETSYSNDRHWLRACCPLHNESHPSFSINVLTGYWKCWAGCGEGRLSDLTLKLVQRGVLLNPRRASQFEFVEPTVQQEFKAPENVSFKKITQSLSERGFTPKQLQHFEAGYDEDKKMMFFLIRDYDGKMQGGLWRNHQGFHPKYINSYGLDRRHVVYGINWLSSHEDTVYLTEGPLDTIWLWLAGIPAVAFLGSNVTKTQIEELMKRQPSSVVLAFDNDLAGLEATQRVGLALIDKVPVRILQFSGVKDIQEVPLEEVKKLRSRNFTELLSNKVN